MNINLSLSVLSLTSRRQWLSYLESFHSHLFLLVFPFCKVKYSMIYMPNRHYDWKIITTEMNKQINK